ncbi:MAG: hypothetical protein WA805_29645 [Trebonia sp.]|uniref:hypothetical protein n=1 Tax=Trebonia sp. TaxID=2767075 RepID=UPI003C909793
MTETAADITRRREGGTPDPSLDAQAAAALSALFDARPGVLADLEKVGPAHAHLGQERQREADALQAQTTAEQHAAGVTAKLDLAGHRFAGFTLGAVIVAVLLFFDAVPLNWAVQAFGLPNAATWLVTGIMLVASAGAMAGLELTRDEPRQRGILLTLMATAYVALGVLRTAFLVTVADESLAVAVLQAVLLSAISAGLVVCGSAVMARTRPLALARALSAAKRACRKTVACRQARRQVEEKMQHHWVVLQRTLREWSLTSAAPAEVSQADWATALEHAMSALFPRW